MVTVVRDENRISELEGAYELRRPALQRAEKKLTDILTEVAANIDDKGLVRAQITETRIKKLTSIKRKAQKHGWSATTALKSCRDLVGGRVVCNNVVDVYRFAELLKECLHGYYDHFDVQDYIKEPNADGYRALHVNLPVNIGEHPFNPDLVSCEVQIRTRLQDGWAELSHADIYKQAGLPEGVRARARDLAELLTTADKIAGDIRLQAMREVAPAEHNPDLSRVSVQGLAFVFKDVFGRSPSEYTVRRALNECENFDVGTLERLPAILGRSKFRENIANAYRAIMGTHATNGDVFIASIRALASGDKEAEKYIKWQARREWREIDQIATREMLASLPETAGKLIEELEDRDAGIDITDWAKAWRATNECSVCGTTIVKPYAFAEAAIQHYELSDPDASEAMNRIEQAIYNSAVETGGWNTSSLCSYHADRAARDD
jgi:putative GTP pyrophosphokinase